MAATMILFAKRWLVRPVSSPKMTNVDVKTRIRNDCLDPQLLNGWVTQNNHHHFLARPDSGAQNNWPTHRLDGTMAITKRMKLVPC